MFFGSFVFYAVIGIANFTAHFLEILLNYPVFVLAMRILVTGGLGFIGSNFIRHILEKYPGYSIINLDKLTYAGNPDNLKDIEDNPAYRFVKGDICDPGIVKRAVGGCDAIVNFAAESHVDRSILNADDFLKTNIFGTYVLLEAAKASNIKRFVQVGTDEAYGSIKSGLFKETDTLKPNSPYSASKAAADMLVRAYSKTFNLPTVITRSSNNFGPYQYPEKLIPLFITNLLENKKVPLYGTGLNVRDWIYVKDNCDAIAFIMHIGETGEIYNIGGSNEKTNLDITRMILKELRKDEGYIEFVKDRPGHDFRYALDCSKIKALGWKPGYHFEAALKETIKWYKENADWWKRLKPAT